MKLWRTVFSGLNVKIKPGISLAAAANIESQICSLNSLQPKGDCQK